MPARLLILIALLAGAVPAQTSPSQSSPAIFSQVDEMLKGLSEITGWKVRRNVPSETLSRDKFAKMVDEGVKGAEGDKETHAAEVTLKMLGLVPQDFDLARESADLITEQAAAFYDYRKKRLFVLDTNQSSDEQRLALAHELAHALADQQHPLQKYINGAKDDEDATARQAVVEGQATWLSWAYLSRRSGRKAEVPAALLDELANSAGATGDGFPVFSQAPLYIRESLTFPYTDGMRFQDAVYRRLGSAAFERVFRDPPRDTQQIIHPDIYLAAIAPVWPMPLALDSVIGKDARHFHAIGEGDIGEFDFSVLLRQFIGERVGREASSHWRGGSYRLYENKETKAPLLAHASEWDSPESARAFFTLYRKVLAGKWKKLEIASSSDREITGSGDSGRFTVRLDGSIVQAIEGIR
ncbi:MAG: ImmA/IrrE family metallo-endopeptidase [Bryobacteraceae bacterium]